MAPVLVLPGEHAFLLHQHLPKGPHFLPYLLFGVPGWAKARSGLPWLEHGLPRDLLRTSNLHEQLVAQGADQKEKWHVDIIRAWRKAGASAWSPVTTLHFCLPLLAVLGRGRDIRKG